ncbi:MAG: VOC family protein [Burkholderiaceae bacterium]
MRWEVDHLVVGAASLAQGEAWCRETFGVAPLPGGQHPLMGTHNRLLSMASPAHPRSYLEIIAIDPQAEPPGRKRWFDLDDTAVQASLAAGPSLLHWVARCGDVAAATRTLGLLGIDRGEILAAGRASPHGTLRWRITVRADGQRLACGALPTLIEWDGVHPAQGLPDSGLRLRTLTLGGLPAGLRSMLPDGVDGPADAEPGLRATFDSPRGRVELVSRS